MRWTEGATAQRRHRLDMMTTSLVSKETWRETPKEQKRPTMSYHDRGMMTTSLLHPLQVLHKTLRPSKRDLTYLCINLFISISKRDLIH
jgi:hypothetical protein